MKMMFTKWKQKDIFYKGLLGMVIRPTLWVGRCETLFWVCSPKTMIL